MTAAPDQAQLSPSGLACLFASRFVAPAARGTTCFATGANVETEPLAISLPVIALWALQQQGYINMRPYEEKRLRVFTSRGVRAVVLRTAALGGLEGAILHALATDKHATSAGADIYRAVRAVVPDSREPFGAAIAIVFDDIVAAGYLIKAPRPAGLGARLRGQPKWTLEAVPQRYQELAARVEALAQAWQAVLADPAYPAVREVVRRAIESCRESDNDGPDLDTGGGPD